MKKALCTMLALGILSAGIARADGEAPTMPENFPERGVLMALPEGNEPGLILRLAPNGNVYYVRVYDTLDPLGPPAPINFTRQKAQPKSMENWR